MELRGRSDAEISCHIAPPNLQHLASYKPLRGDDNVEMYVGEKDSGNADEEQRKRKEGEKKSREETNSERILFSLLRGGKMYFSLMSQGTCGVRDTSKIRHPYFLWEPNPHPGIQVSSNLYNFLSFSFLQIFI